MSIHNEVNRKARLAAGVNSPAEVSSPAEASIPQVDTAEAFAPLARTKRVPRRAKTERGLPADESLARLARRYLEIQGKNWPKLVEAGLLPPAADEVVAEMVHDFKIRHRSGNVDPALLKPFTMLVRTLGGSYCRYSCDNSTDLSIDDQMAKILAKALADHCFIPWLYVYCDYSVTGQDASRQGYASYKRVLSDGENHIACTYIDDFTRASRNEIEWWRLASLSKRLGKRLVGASDGFNLSDPNSDVMITVFGLVSRQFIKGLKEKVKRGMHGAARRGTCLGKLSLGFTRRVLRTQSGDAVRDAEGVATHDICIDPAASADRRRIYEMFVNNRLTTFKIARRFNAEKVDGWSGWTDAGIKKLLRNPSSIGVFIWNRTRREFDLETDKWKVVRNPRKEWTVKFRPELALVPLDLWRAACRRLAEMRRGSLLTGRDYSRNRISATTLFSGTLFCQSCGGELKLIRSTPKYKQIGCMNGLNRGHDCKLSTSKSVRVIEDCLLSYLRDSLLTDDVLEQLVLQANQLLVEESNKPVVNLAPLKADKRTTTAKITRLVRQIEESDDKRLTSGYSQRVTELERQLSGIKVAIRNANVGNNRRPGPLQFDQVKVYLENLRRLLKCDIAEAAAAIRTITGPISIRQEKIPGRSRGTRWVASFHPQWNEVLGHIAKNDSGSVIKGLDLAIRVVEVPIEKVPQYVTLADEFKRLHTQGSSIASLAAAHGMCWKQASDILHYANTGECPKGHTRKPTGRGQNRKYTAIAQQVAELRDRQLSFKKIAAQLEVSEETVRRAYDHARPAEVRAAAENSTSVRRGRYRHLSADKYAAIREKIRNGESNRQIAEDVGCSSTTVLNYRKKLSPLTTVPPSDDASATSPLIDKIRD